MSGRPHLGTAVTQGSAVSSAILYVLAAVCSACGGSSSAAQDPAAALDAGSDASNEDASAIDATEGPETASGGAGGSLLIGGAAGSMSGGTAGTGKGGSAGSASGGAAGSSGGGGTTSNCKEQCLQGCCDANGECRPGTEMHACGIGGHTCTDCAAAGFIHCEPNLQTCTDKSKVCLPQTCPNGCCLGPACLEGKSPKACGTGGLTCKVCEQDCDPGTNTCTESDCGPGTCASGCCLAGTCVPGKDSWACGSGGQVCANCTTLGQTCQLEPGSTGGQCKPPLCNASSCPGCCVADLCVVGTQHHACGTGGKACINCTASWKECVGGVCD